MVIDIAAAVGSRLPAGFSHGLAAIGGTIEWLVRPGLRRTLATNLAHAVGAPPDSRVVRRAVRREARGG